MSDHGRGEHSGHDVGETPPDSDAREVTCSALTPARQCARASDHQGSHEFRLLPRELVSLPLPLAQRILAALDELILDSERSEPKLRRLAAELRERMPK